MVFKPSDFIIEFLKAQTFCYGPFPEVFAEGFSPFRGQLLSPLHPFQFRRSEYLLLILKNGIVSKGQFTVVDSSSLSRRTAYPSSILSTVNLREISDTTFEFKDYNFYKVCSRLLWQTLWFGTSPGLKA